MSKQQKDFLFQLIKSLNKAEKRHFKLYTRRNSAGGDPLYLKLFDFLDRQKEYKEEQILTKVKGIRKSQLANIKANLYRQILVSLRLVHRNQEIDIAVREQLDFAQVLYSKGLYRQSLNILERAKQKAIELNLYTLALEILSFEKLIESQYITRSIDTKADELSATSEQLVEVVSGINKFSNLSIQLYGLYLKMGYARNQEELSYAKDYFKKHLPPHRESKLSFYEKLYLYQSYVWLFNITHEFPRQYRYAQKWVDLFHQYPTFIKLNIPLYIKGLHNLLNTLFLTYQDEKFTEVLLELNSFNANRQYDLNANETSILVLFRYIHKFNKHYLEGSFTAGTEWVEELVNEIKSGKYNWDDHRVMVFYYKIASLYFGSGNNEKAIEFLNKIINRVNPNFREDIQCFARILSLIAHYELGNDVLVSYQLKSVYRFLSKMEELNAMHATILKFLRKTPEMNRLQVKKEFIQLKKTLESLQHKRFEKRSLLYLDIISWLESKIYKKPVEEIIRSKYLERVKAIETKV